MAFFLCPAHAQKSAPSIYGVYGEVEGCALGTAIIKIARSQTDVTYELYKNGEATGLTKAGTGKTLRWGGQTAGAYTVYTVETERYTGGVQMGTTGHTTVRVADLCGVVEFTGAGENSLWSNTDNWSGGALPTIDNEVHVLQPVTVDIPDAQAEKIILYQTEEHHGAIEIAAGKALVVAQTVRKTTDGETMTATDYGDLRFGSTLAAGNGALVMGAHDGTNKATVNFAIQAYYDATRGYVNQYIGTPFNDENDIQYNYYGSWVAKYVPEDGGSWAWIGYSDGNGNNMVPFMGYNILRPEESQNIVLWMQGTLNSSTNQTLTTADAPAARLYYNGSSNTQNLLANSWMAPIDISKFDVDGKGEDDFTNVDATIYIFNAGSPKDFTDNSGAIGSSSKTTTSPGQYTAIPVNDRPSGYNTIPSMQAFIVLANAASPSITLDYNRLVYTPATIGVTIEPNKAPQRLTQTDEPIRLSIRVQGESGYSDNIRISERADFTTDFDQGWEGRKLYGVAEAPQLYVMGVDKLAIAAVPEMEGTLIGLKAGEADNSYTFTFEYEEAEALYLLDTYMNTYTRVQTGARYTFATPDKNEHNRFILTHRTPSIATEVEPIGNGQGKMDNCRKVLMEDHIYIIRGGRLYDATGKLVNNATEEGGAL
jgi:hypothetical protein